MGFRGRATALASAGLILAACGSSDADARDATTTEANVSSLLSSQGLAEPATAALVSFDEEGKPRAGQGVIGTVMLRSVPKPDSEEQDLEVTGLIAGFAVAAPGHGGRYQQSFSVKADAQNGEGRSVPIQSDSVNIASTEVKIHVPAEKIANWSKRDDNCSEKDGKPLGGQLIAEARLAKDAGFELSGNSEYHIGFQRFCGRIVQEPGQAAKVTDLWWEQGDGVKSIFASPLDITLGHGTRAASMVEYVERYSKEVFKRGIGSPPSTGASTCSM